MAAQVDDPRRWITLAIVLMATMIVVLDNTVLNVAIPTILRDFKTTLPSLEWVVTGYALTFATLLIIGGRLCDVYGTRRIFIIGAALFGAGSLLASVSWNVGSLVLAEAVIEGMGASLMLPAALAVLSSAFAGRERGMAFAMWGAVAGSAAGLGPVVGGLVTTEWSWRWAFRINVILAPLAILGATLFIARGVRAARREPLDFPGAALIASGMFLLVFALSEGGTYGWFRPITTFSLWPEAAPVSVVPVGLGASIVLLVVFVRYEVRRGEGGRSPLFDFSLLRSPTFRYGLIATGVLSMAALGFSLAMALYLQEALRLSPLDNGLWMLPYGLMILAASPVGGWLTHRLSTLDVARIGLLGQTVGLVAILVTLRSDESLLRFLPGVFVYGLGSGFAFAQLTNVILSDLPLDKAGVASGTNTTVRQVGNALGIAVIGTIVTTRTVAGATHAITVSPALTPAAQRAALAGVHAFGANYPAPPGVVERILGSAVTGATRDALVFAIAVAVVGTALSFLIPRRPVDPLRLPEELASLVPIDPEGELAAGLD